MITDWFITAKRTMFMFLFMFNDVVQESDGDMKDNVVDEGYDNGNDVQDTDE